MLLQRISQYSVLAMLAGALLAGPVDAQGKGNGKGKKDKERPELVRRTNQSGQAKAPRRTESVDRLRERRGATQPQRVDRRDDRYEDRRDDRYEDDRWDDDRYDDDRWDDRYDERWDDRSGDKQGPPFCRNGKGHPVHGWEWCRQKGYDRGGYGRYEGDYDRDRRYDDRNYGSYDRAHSEFHRQHDRQCRMRAAERPLDIQWQLRVRTECKRRHDEWHYRAGRSHG